MVKLDCCSSFTFSPHGYPVIPTLFIQQYIIFSSGKLIDVRDSHEWQLHCSLVTSMEWETLGQNGEDVSLLAISPTVKTEKMKKQTNTHPDKHAQTDPAGLSPMEGTQGRMEGTQAGRINHTAGNSTEACTSVLRIWGCYNNKASIPSLFSLWILFFNVKTNEQAISPKCLWLTLQGLWLSAVLERLPKAPERSDLVFLSRREIGSISAGSGEEGWGG